MTGYRDMTFCDAKCSNDECRRKLKALDFEGSTPSVKRAGT